MCIHKQNYPATHPFCMKLQDQQIAVLLHTPNSQSSFDRSLVRHAEELAKQSEQANRLKLERNQEKHEKIKEIQTNFIKWAEHKSTVFQKKQEHVQQKRSEHIAKVVKRCQDRGKYVVKKQQDYKIVKKKRLNVDWKKAEKFNEDIQSYYKSKHFMSRTMKPDHSGRSLHLDRSPEDEAQIKNSSKPHQMNQSVFLTNTSKIYSSMNKNQDMHGANNESSPRNTKSVYRAIKKTNQNFRSQSPTIHDYPNDEDDYKDKFNEALEKMREKQREQEMEKIQQLGEKYHKIEKNREKKREMYEKKYSKNHAERERNLTYDDNDTYKNKKNVKVNNKDERLHSETSYRKLSKIRDRTEETKQRRQEMLEQHLSCGDEYLHNLKVKHLKTVIAKNITYNSMEKRLFLERLKN